MEQLPGQPGNQKTSCTYYQGVSSRRTGAPHDENYMGITAEGKHRFRVVKGLPIEEQERRFSALREAEKARAQARKEEEYQASIARLAQRKRESTAAVLRDQLQVGVDSLRRTLRSCQQGQDLLHDWCLPEGDLQRVLRQVEMLDRAVREVTPIRHSSHSVARLSLVQS
ncbi:hypothetical protein [Variovorax boronicumulans]|uniref:hypothetical protein n=1 Tax=Variovorax boronicumulans TaxID=436515 RepID=UPI00078343F5|nr:hypothetical protein [Variovorax boronicumulans]